MQICFNLAFIFIYVTLIMAQDAPKRRFLSLIFLVLCISKSFLIDLFFFEYLIVLALTPFLLIPTELFFYNVGVFIQNLRIINLFNESV